MATQPDAKRARAADTESATPPGTPPPERAASPVPYFPLLHGCRSVDEYERLNLIDEGAYGVVFRARDRATGDIYALKKFKGDNTKEGFPITALREINTLIKSYHENIVFAREIVMSPQNAVFLVMEFLEHDVKALMETMTQPFLAAEVKTLMRQLLSGMDHLHSHWIIHRDLKPSNLLMSHRGVLKIADFGLAREYGSPLKAYTHEVVTLWYRAPEVLLGAPKYSTALDMWSVGCIFAEFITRKPLFTGARSEIELLQKMFTLLGTPTETIWSGFLELPTVRKVQFKQLPPGALRREFSYLTEAAFQLLTGFLTYDPNRRITAAAALSHRYFAEAPTATPPELFPYWPAKSEGHRLRATKSPVFGRAADGPAGHAGDDDRYVLPGAAGGAGFRLQ